MRKILCPFAGTEFDCQTCTEIKDDEKCPYMLADEFVDEMIAWFVQKKEREMNEKSCSRMG